MSDKETQVIQKLIKIMSNQQKILTKLAQQQDPHIQYLREAAQVAGANSQPPMSVIADVTVNPGFQHDNVSAPETYTTKVSGVPEDNKAKQSFMDTFKRQIKSQKPDLDGRVSIIFTPGTVPSRSV
jgi:hypothetical protein